MVMCAFCKKPIKPGDPVIRLSGGFFDPQEQDDFFVEDDDVLKETFVHRVELVDRLIPKPVS